MHTSTSSHILRLPFVAAAVLLLLASAMPVAAQSGSVEITPMIGYRWGGTILKEDNPTLGEDAELRDNHSLGLVIDVPLSRHLQIELSADRQSTGLSDAGLFAPADHTFDLDVNYYHIGVVGQWPLGVVTPFVSGGVGIADLRPELTGLESSRRFSTTIGGGIKLGLSEHIAFRLEGRGYWTDTSDEEWRWSRDDDECRHHDHCRDRNTDLVQGQVRVGISFIF